MWLKLYGREAVSHKFKNGLKTLNIRDEFEMDSSSSRAMKVPSRAELGTSIFELKSS